MAADWYEGDTNQVILVLPGFTSTRERYSALASYLQAKTQHSVLVLEYSGHGESTIKLEKITGSQNFSEVVRAFDWIRDNHPEKEITVLGTSYGGLHATLLTKYRDYENIILRVPAAYDERSIYTPIGRLEDLHDPKYRLNPDNFSEIEENWMFSHTNAVKGRSFVIIHENDTVCPEPSTRAFAKAFDADVWVAPGLQHGFKESNLSEEDELAYYQKIVDWILE